MGRPPLGRAKRSRTIGVHVTQDQYELIAQQGIPGVWARQVVLAALDAALAPRRKPATPTQPPPTKAPAKRPPQPALETPADTQHRHKRVRVGEKWVGGVDVGEWRCGDPECGVTLGILQ